MTVGCWTVVGLKLAAVVSVIKICNIGKGATDRQCVFPKSKVALLVFVKNLFCDVIQILLSAVLSVI